MRLEHHGVKRRDKEEEGEYCSGRLDLEMVGQRKGGTCQCK